MPSRSGPDLSLFLDILRQLEEIGVPYVIIGGFAAAIYGITRATYDIDIIIDLDEEHIQALVDAYPPPRYYADPHQMLQAMRTGSPFNHRHVPWRRFRTWREGRSVSHHDERAISPCPR